MRVSVVMLPGSVSRLAGGLFTSVRRLSECISDAEGFDIQIIGHRDQFTEEDLRAWRARPHLLRSRTVVGRARELQKCLTHEQYSIVHSHFIWSYASIAARRVSRSIASQLHVISPRGMLDPWALKRSQLKKRIASYLFEFEHLRTAACLHALSESEADSIRRLGLKNPICVIPNGIDLPQTRPLEARAFDSPVRTMLFLGRLHPKKGLVPLLQAWALARKSLLQWRLHIGGWDDGGHLVELQKMIKELDLDAHVALVGPLYGSEKISALSSADAFVLPSFSEGLPMSVLEAWSYGLPVLMTRHCNLAQAFESHSAKEISLNPVELANALALFASMPESSRVDMGRNGRRLVENAFQWATVSSQMASVYRWLLGIDQRPACVSL